MFYLLCFFVSFYVQASDLALRRAPLEFIDFIPGDKIITFNQSLDINAFETSVMLSKGCSLYFDAKPSNRTIYHGAKFLVRSYKLQPFLEKNSYEIELQNMDTNSSAVLYLVVKPLNADGEVLNKWPSVGDIKSSCLNLLSVGFTKKLRSDIFSNNALLITDESSSLTLAIYDLKRVFSGYYLGDFDYSSFRHEGYGIYTSYEKFSYEGRWREGKKHGPFRVTTSEGKVSLLTYEYDEEVRDSF